MNWLDLVIAGVALLGLFIGLRMGLLGAIFNAVGVVVGAFIAPRISDDIAAWFTKQGMGHAIATVLAYVAIIVALMLAAQVARRITKKVFSLVLLGWMDTVGGLFIGLLFGLALSAAVVLGLVRLSTNVPANGVAAVLGERVSGFQSSIQDALVGSVLAAAFIRVTNALPANAMGFVPGEFSVALRQIEQRINQTKQP